MTVAPNSTLTYLSFPIQQKKATLFSSSPYTTCSSCHNTTPRFASTTNYNLFPYLYCQYYFLLSATVFTAVCRSMQIEYKSIGNSPAQTHTHTETHSLIVTKAIDVRLGTHTVRQDPLHS